VELRDEPDHYLEGPFLVFTAAHHLRRGSCCGSQCRHCPFEPRGVKGNDRRQAAFLDAGRA